MYVCISKCSSKETINILIRQIIYAKQNNSFVVYLMIDMINKKKNTEHITFLFGSNALIIRAVCLIGVQIEAAWPM